MSVVVSWSVTCHPLHHPGLIYLCCIEDNNCIICFSKTAQIQNCRKDGIEWVLKVNIEQKQ